MNNIQYAWLIYVVGGLGCCIATWWMFLWAWRFVRYSAVVTVVTLLFTPYAIDPQTMMMAPAIYTLVFNGIGLGLDAILPLIKLMLGIWFIGIILVLVFVLLTRKSGKTYKPVPAPAAARKQNNSSYNAHKLAEPNKSQSRASSSRELFSRDSLSYEERQARDELLAGEMPMRALRD
ncbi:MAG TPA: hypothetical protein VN030_07055 [Cellvibrio sp.]|nr:hypothetical protein [Cellvibrio sp.]